MESAADGKDGRDRRIHDRLDANFGTEVTLFDVRSQRAIAEHMSGRVLDVSRGGLRLEVNGLTPESMRAIELGEVLILCTMTHPSGEHLRSVCEIKWRNQTPSEGGRVSLGVRFLHLDMTLLERLNNWLSPKKPEARVWTFSGAWGLLLLVGIGLGVQSYRLSLAQQALHISEDQVISEEQRALSLSAQQRATAEQLTTALVRLRESDAAFTALKSEIAKEEVLEHKFVVSTQSRNDKAMVTLRSLTFGRDHVIGVIERTRNPERKALIDVTVTAADGSQAGECPQAMLDINAPHASFECKVKGRPVEPLDVYLVQH